MLLLDMISGGLNNAYPGGRLWASPKELLGNDLELIIQDNKKQREAYWNTHSYLQVS